MRLPDYFQPIAAPIPASRTRRRGRRCPSCSPRLFAGTARRSAASSYIKKYAKLRAAAALGEFPGQGRHRPDAASAGKGAFQQLPPAFQSVRQRVPLPLFHGRQGLHQSQRVPGGKRLNKIPCLLGQRCKKPAPTSTRTPPRSPPFGTSSSRACPKFPIPPSTAIRCIACPAM